MKFMRPLLLVAMLCFAAGALADTFSYTWTGTEATRLGRLFRDHHPTIRRNVIKTFPGMTAEASTFRWIQLSFTNPITTGPAIATIYTNDQYDSTFLAAYSASGPGAGIMSTNYLGDQGFSTPGVWAVLFRSARPLG